MTYPGMQIDVSTVRKVVMTVHSNASLTPDMLRAFLAALDKALIPPDARIAVSQVSGSITFGVQSAPDKFIGL